MSNLVKSGRLHTVSFLCKLLLWHEDFGKRLRPITCCLPKPIVPVANKPMLYHIINFLKQYDLLDLTMILYHQSDTIIDYFNDGKKFGVTIKYIRPDSNLGASGIVKYASKNIKDTFLF